MGFLNRLFGAASTSTDNLEVSPRSIEATLYTGDEALEVVGESNYQEALWQIVGGRRHDRVRHDVAAVLVPEPDNRFDANAIKVLIDGNLVGYLSRQDAVAYGPGLLALMNESANGLVALDATIVGGGQRSDGYGFLGVFIDHDPADFGISPTRAGDASGFRTGLSEAVATDLADDGYDLSWYRELSDNDIVAIRKLRHMLEADPDPIDRHYMMCELEQRLYKSRDAFASALDEFDAVCRQHDAEMVTIRPALFAPSRGQSDDQSRCAANRHPTCRGQRRCLVCRASLTTLRSPADVSRWRLSPLSAENSDAWAVVHQPIPVGRQ